MAIQLKHRLPTGETRPWTLREIIQGRPVDRPTHPMLVHFPIAFYIGALVVDVMSRIWTFPSAPLMATWLLIGAFIGTAGAATTGLADLISPHARTVQHYEPWLTLYGLRIIFERNS